MKRHCLLILCAVTALAAGLRAQAATPPLRIACVGDSITQGFRSTSPYPAQLQTLLGEAYVVKNFGVGGRTLLKEGDLPYWKEKAYADAKDFQPNIVVIMLGTNDTKAQNWKFEDKFAAEYKELVESFKSLDSKPLIFVCRPPPVVGRGNFGINEPNLLALFPIIDEVAKDEGATVLDMHEALKDHADTETDTVHPSAAGDAIIAKVVADAVIKAEAATPAAPTP
jgi:lysophospholipase L1-like esterase